MVSDLVEDAETLLPIDLVRLDRVSEPFQAAITKEGERLYRR